VSEIVSTLWFEDTRFLNEQMLDTPLGRFSIRQMCIFLIFGLLAWVVSLLFSDLVLKLVVAGAIFFTGAALFTRKIKTVSPEAHLLCLIKRFTMQIRQKQLTPKGRQSVEQTSTSLLLSATLGMPVKLAGVLKDLTGKILSGKNFKVSVNNMAYSKGATDEEGYFYTYFIPDHIGLFKVDIQPEDSNEPIQQITVKVNPKTEEEKQNANPPTKTKTQT